jgi:SH3-like domain-containing protein
LGFNRLRLIREAALAALFRSLVLALIVASVGAAQAAPDAEPYFASLKSDKVFMREGPSDDSKVKWVYHRKGLPVEVLAHFDVWRRVRDMDGEIGWIHTALIAHDRTAVVIGAGNAMARAREAAGSAIVATVKPGAIGKLVACGAAACEVKFAAVTGWLDRARLWGVHDGEKF